jgi:pyrroloquinoline-quinone synthase
MPGFVHELAAELRKHPVNANAFFRAFEAEHLSRDRLCVFVCQYHYFCKHFVKLLEGLLFHTPIDQTEMRIELVKTLYSEWGNGRPDQAHLALLGRFAGALGLTTADFAATLPLPAVTQYLRLLQRLFMDSDHLAALGAETAVEVTAASEFNSLYPGLKKYSCFQEDDLIFFRLHMQEELTHGQWLLQAVERTAPTPETQARVLAAARETADAWHAFWLGLYEPVFGRPLGAAA